MPPIIPSTPSISTILISSAVLSASSIKANYISANTVQFLTLKGGNVSSLSGQVGILNATQATTSSFSGNYNDAHTMIIQYI